MNESCQVLFLQHMRNLNETVTEIAERAVSIARNIH